jgi:glutamyl-tRNA reductase
MLYLIGINHKTADLDTREKLWLSDAELRNLLPAFQEEFFEECFVVSTCNRTELYGVPSRNNAYLPDEEYYRTIEQRLTGLAKPGASFNPGNFYRLKDMPAARHLLEVSTGLDSMVIGDVQILNQIRQHYNLAMELKTNGPILNKLLHVAIHSGKRTKTETEISKGAVSVSYAAVELASKIYFNLNEKTVLLIGAGETGELTAKHLVGRGIQKLLITNRTFQRSEDLARELEATAVPFEELNQNLLKADIVISSINSTGYVISKPQAAGLMSKRKHSPLLIIDLGVPRNIDPEVNSLDNIFLHDLDTMSGIVQQSMINRQKCIPDVNRIIEEELDEFSRWTRSHSVAPIVDELKSVYDIIRAEELNYHIHKFRDEDKDLVEHLTRRIVHRLVQLPAGSLRNGIDETKQQKEMKLNLVRKLFGLNGKSGESSM